MTEELQQTPPKVEVNLEPLQKRKLFIATPAYGGQMHANYVRGLLGLQQLLTQLSIGHQIQFMYNESLITRARNTLADMFMRSDCTDLMWIDADIEFNPQDVVLLMHFDLPMIGAAYPLKTIMWDKVKEALAKHPDIPVNELPAVASKWVVHFEGDKVELSYAPAECHELGTGFMLCKREVFEQLQPSIPTFKAPPDAPNAGDTIYDYFQVGIHNDRYESEDYFFCRKWKESGGKIYVCPWMNLTHHGNWPFPGDMRISGHYLGEIN